MKMPARKIVRNLKIAVAWCSYLAAFATAAGFGVRDRPASASTIQVSTYHGDGHRTGWNSQETLLAPAKVASAGFRELGNVALDGQVDAQPLYVGGQVIGRRAHNAIYTVTENDTVYAIDADTGAVLLQRNFGIPVPITKLPGFCNSNSGIVGINATPVIDPVARTLYVIVYTYENNAPVYRIHALDLGTLADKVPPVVVTGSGTLNPTNAKYDFNPATARSRAALLLNNGAVYAAFTGFCDLNANIARGWVLGWDAGTLLPLAPSVLLSRESSTPNNYFLSTVWMSGYGIAVDNAGSLFVVTGNSDPSGTAYQPPYGIAQSVVKLSSDLATVQSVFTPAGGSGADYATLERSDLDFGAGGVMVLPPQPGPYPYLVVAAGKYGAMYLLNSNDLGGYDEGPFPYPDRIFNSYTIGTCYCGESYFAGADGVGRVVSSGGNNVMVWRVNSSGIPSLSQESISAPIVNGTNQGFFTTISSNGVRAKSQVIWALGRPIDASAPIVTLYAFDPSAIDGSGRMATLFAGAAGSWPRFGRANLVPTVANGRVYVGSYKQLAIFGLSGTSDLVSFTASGTLAEGVGPLVNVVVDGKIIGTTSVGTTTATYSFSTTLAPNIHHDIQIQYINDITLPRRDRNLILNSIGVDGRTISATSAYEVYHAQAGGQGDIPSSGNMYWSGTAEFRLPATLFPLMPAGVKSLKTSVVARTSTTPSIQAEADPILPGHSLYGFLTAMQKGALTLRTRTGALIAVDDSEAVKTHRSVIPVIGGALLVHGEYDAAGVLHAVSILKAQDLKTLWGQDS